MKKIKVDNFQYQIGKKHKIVGILVETEKTLTLVLKPHAFKTIALENKKEN
jgi:hypothetical protein